MKKSSDLRVIKTKQIIRAAVLDIMTRKSLADISVTEVAKKAMVNRKTFYNHYSTVNDVLEDLIQEVIDSITDKMNFDSKSCLKIGDVLYYLARSISEYKDQLSVILKYCPEYYYNGKTQAILLRLSEVSIQNIADIPDESILKMVSLFAASGIIAVYTRWLADNCNTDAEIIVEVTKKLVYGSLVQFISDEDLKKIDL